VKAWIYQDDKQIKRHGADKASYYVGWIDPEGKRRCKSCGPGAKGKSIAAKVRQRIEAELLTGTYQDRSKRTWGEFRQEFESKVLERLAPRSRNEVKTALDTFERIAKPGKMATIKTSTIDSFIAIRRTEAGKKKGDLISPATTNKDLRHLRVALRKARKWGYLAAVPDFDFEKEHQSLVVFVTPVHFALIYKACDQAVLPVGLPYPAADWWRGLLTMAYMTGWRISELLALRRPDLDLDQGFAITRAEDNKGKRDERVKLHSVAVEHLRKLPAFDPRVFPWNHDRTTLMKVFAKLQEDAGIKLDCRGTHEHTRFCHVYGFHDIRRAFATKNATRLSADQLQGLMRHKSYLTTQKYISMASQLDDAVASLHVPDVLKTAQC
jgi:integrase